MIREKGRKKNLINAVIKFIDARTAYINMNLEEQSNRSPYVDDRKAGAGALLADIVIEDTTCFKFEATPNCQPSTGDGLIDLQDHDKRK